MCLMFFRRCRRLNSDLLTQKALNFAIEKHDVIAKFAEFVFAEGEGGLYRLGCVHSGSFC
jgi:uncharacterized protein (DUF924 family)